MVISVTPPVKIFFRGHFRIQFEQVTLANVWVLPETAGEPDFSRTALNRP